MTGPNARAIAAAKFLRQARREARLEAAFPEGQAPATAAEAYAVQDMLAERLGVPAAGWKIGATAPAVQAAIGLESPFYGRIFAYTVYASGTALPAGRGHNILEAELAARLERTLPFARSDWTRDSIAGEIASLHPAIEINRPSWRDPFKMRGLDVIADNGSNAGAVLGAAMTDWRRRDLAALAVSFRVGGAEKARGTGAAVMGHPLAALAWLANERARRGRPLQAGDIVATGSFMGFVACRAGDAVEAVFDGEKPVAMSLG